MGRSLMLRRLICINLADSLRDNCRSSRIANRIPVVMLGRERFASRWWTDFKDDWKLDIQPRSTIGRLTNVIADLMSGCGVGMLSYLTGNGFSDGSIDQSISACSVIEQLDASQV